MSAPRAKTSTAAARPRLISLGRGRYDRTQSSDQRRREQRTRLLDAATRVFARDSAARATVEAIVTEAGMSRRTFYEHFDGVGHVLDKVYDRAARLAYAAVEQIVRAESDPIAQVRVGVAAYLGLVAMNADAARVVFQEYRRAGLEQELRFERDGERYAQLLLESLSAAHAAGQIEQPPNEVACFALIKGVEAVAIRHLLRREEDRLTAAVPALTELVLGAFRGPTIHSRRSGRPR